MLKFKKVTTTELIDLLVHFMEKEISMEVSRTNPYKEMVKERGTNPIKEMNKELLKSRVVKDKSSNTNSSTANSDGSKVDEDPILKTTDSNIKTSFDILKKEFGFKPNKGLDYKKDIENNSGFDDLVKQFNKGVIRTNIEKEIHNKSPVESPVESPVDSYMISSLLLKNKKLKKKITLLESQISDLYASIENVENYVKESIDQINTQDCRHCEDDNVEGNAEGNAEDSCDTCLNMKYITINDYLIENGIDNDMKNIKYLGKLADSHCKDTLTTIHINFHEDTYKKIKSYPRYILDCITSE